MKQVVSTMVDRFRRSKHRADSISYFIQFLLLWQFGGFTQHRDAKPHPLIRLIRFTAGTGDLHPPK